jgi:hypothetical protein
MYTPIMKTVFMEAYVSEKKFEIFSKKRPFEHYRRLNSSERKLSLS